MKYSQGEMLPLETKQFFGRIIIKWIFRKWEVVVRTGWSWLRIGKGEGHL